MNMKQKKPIAALAGALLLSSVASQAAEPSFATGGYARGGQGMRTMEMMKHLDKDGNRFVTHEEFMAYHDKMFEMMDRKKAGKLDKDDWLLEQRMISDGSVSFGAGGYARGGEGMRTKEMMEQMDHDKDHHISRAEFKEFHKMLVEMMDKNKDGKIGEDEWAGK